MRAFPSVLLLAVVLQSASCDTGDAPRPDGALASWRLSDEPGVVIGGADEREGYLLHQVIGATRLGDGRIVVANGSSLQLRYYDPEGRHLFDAGGEGEGPGELQPPLEHFTRLAGDSILVASWQSGFTRFGPDGRYASSIPYQLPSRGRCWQTEGDQLLPDGSFLLRYSGAGRSTSDNAPCPQLTGGRTPVVIGRYIPTTTYIDTIALLPGFERTSDPLTRMHAYPQDLVLGAGLDRVYVGDTGSDTFLALSFSGDTIGALPVPFEPAPVPAGAKSKLSEDVTLTGGEQTWTERWTFIYPDRYPRYARLVAAPEDRVWVMAYPPLKEPAFPQELVHPVGAPRLVEGGWWRVVNPDGLAIAELRTPPSFFLLEVGNDVVIGLHKDELGRESVQLYRLMR